MVQIAIATAIFFGIQPKLHTGSTNSNSGISRIVKIILYILF